MIENQNCFYLPINHFHRNQKRKKDSKHVQKSKTINSNRFVMKLLYFALFHSRIEYASTNWATATKTQLNRIQVLQNKAIKRCYKLKNRNHTLDLYTKVARNVIPVVALKDFQACKITQTIVNKIKPNKILFEFKNRESRRGVEIATSIQPHNQYGYNSISYNGPIQFNSLPCEIKNCTNTKKFQKKIKTLYCKLEAQIVN